jgi:predicted phosphodiesterase
VRIAIVSDVHGNLTALDAVISDLERCAPDLVLHGGDLALAGAQPAEVIDRVRELAWPGVVGNVDELLWKPEEHAVQSERAPKLAQLLDLLFGTYAPATREMIGSERIGWLRGLSGEHRQAGLLLLHAAPGDLWRAPLPDAPDSELLETYGDCDSSTVVYGHIHRPYVRRVGSMTIANSGSVGSPLDGDPRPSYLLIQNGEPEVIRVDYDVEREVAVVLRSGYPDAPRIAEMRRCGSFIPPAPA